MAYLDESFLKNLKFKYLWLFVTEKCNLSCDYCFYKFRGSKLSINRTMLERSFDFFKNLRDAEFVISGGEPALDWASTQEIIIYLRKKDPKKYILLQTNATLLDSNKINFIKKNKISLEIGLDGNLKTTLSHRMGSRNFFGSLLNNIKMAKGSGVTVYVTMTVHPDQVKMMFENFLFISELGVDKIEITPSAFTPWPDLDVDIFKKEYKKIVKKFLIIRKLKKISVEYDKILKEPVFDFIMMPGNRVLFNWAMLSLPNYLKNKYSFYNIKTDNFQIPRNYILGDYLDYFSGSRNFTYRDYSDLNVNFCYNLLYPKKAKRLFSNYKNISTFLKNLNQKIYGVYNEN